MPSSKNLPTLMCTGCANYEFHKSSSSPHHCKDCNSFTNSSKCHQNPDKDGTSSNSCKHFRPR